jgi:hypothetical protein
MADKGTNDGKDEGRRNCNRNDNSRFLRDDKQRTGNCKGNILSLRLRLSLRPSAELRGLVVGGRREAKASLYLKGNDNDRFLQDDKQGQRQPKIPAG